MFFLVENVEKCSIYHNLLTTINVPEKFIMSIMIEAINKECEYSLYELLFRW